MHCVRYHCVVGIWGYNYQMSISNQALCKGEDLCTTWLSLNIFILLAVSWKAFLFFFFFAISQVKALVCVWQLYGSRCPNVS